jgi:hypothetical protein
MNPKYPLRLTCIVDVVGERPELTDEQAAREHTPEIERDRNPGRFGFEEAPEHEQEADHHRLRCSKDPSPRQQTHGAGVGLNDKPHDHPGDELHVWDVVGTQRIDELGARRRFDDVVAGHREEGVGKHQESRHPFVLAEIDQGAKNPLQHGHSLSHAVPEVNCATDGLAGAALLRRASRRGAARSFFLSVCRGRGRVVPAGSPDP